MVYIGEGFKRGIVGDNIVINAGSKLLVTTLAANSDKNPALKTLTTDDTTAPVVDAETIELTADVEVFVRKGTVLHFASDATVTVTADTTVDTTATTVPCEPIAATAPATSDPAIIWGLLDVKGITNVPLTFNDETVTNKILSDGLQSSDVTVSNMLESAITLDNDPGDKGYQEIIRAYSGATENIFALIVKGGNADMTKNYLVWGPAKVRNLNSDGGINEIDRPSHTLSFQAGWAAPALYDYVTDIGSKTAEQLQTEMNNAAKYAGLPAFA